MGITPVGQAEWMSERIVSRHLKPLTYHGRPPRADGPAVEESCSPRHRALRTGETPVIQQGSSRLESRSGTHCGFGTWRTALRLPFALRAVLSPPRGANPRFASSFAKSALYLSSALRCCWARAAAALAAGFP